jgi:hypothetical protein
VNEADPDAIGPDDMVRLRCYLSMAHKVWFPAGYDGLTSCGHVTPISVRAAIQIMGPEATMRQLARRLRCSNRQVGVTVNPDVRPAEIQASEGPRPETRAGLGK